ncbi:hypothetical protein HPB50_004601 [Hyalomma asiaticum]|uniref:Uncharacterized protein n=1 Tax=Hyalomma asiaticum TaxID=266040 RepID=A0ACB7TF93_HYAAI|nr:hypothetical protein HPB50_004601 [Hyalomma asiaticum]
MELREPKNRTDDIGFENKHSGSSECRNKSAVIGCSMRSRLVIYLAFGELRKEISSCSIATSCDRNVPPGPRPPLVSSSITFRAAPFGQRLRSGDAVQAAARLGAIYTKTRLCALRNQRRPFQISSRGLRKRFGAPPSGTENPIKCSDDRARAPTIVPLHGGEHSCCPSPSEPER